MNGDIVKVKKYVSLGADINVEFKYGWTPVHFAVAQNKPELTRFLIDQHAALNTHNQLISPLHTASSLHNLENVVLLVKNGADVNAIDINHLTPLMYCLSSSDYSFDVADYLITNHADVNGVDAFGHCPLYYALNTGDIKIILRLVSLTRLNVMKKIDPPVLIWALNHQEEVLATILVHRGVSGRAIGPLGESPLPLALQNDYYKLAKILIYNGADVNGTLVDGSSLLEIAISKHQNDLVRLLISRRVNINQADKQGTTPLMIAAKSGNGEIVGLLLKHGADRSARDKTMRTAKQWAAEMSHSDIDSLLSK